MAVCSLHEKEMLEGLSLVSITSLLHLEIDLYATPPNKLGHRKEVKGERQVEVPVEKIPN